MRIWAILRFSAITGLLLTSVTQGAASTLSGTLEAGSDGAFKIVQPVQVGNARGIQSYNGTITNFSGAARRIESQLTNIYFRVHQGMVSVEGTPKGQPLPAAFAVQRDGTLRIGAEFQKDASTFSLQLIVSGDQVYGTYFDSSGLIVHGSGGAIASSSSTSWSGSFRAALAPMPPRELPPLPPVGLALTNDILFNGRIVLQWQAGEDPSGIRGYAIYRRVDLMGERVKIGMTRGTAFADTSPGLRHLSLMTAVFYSVTAVGMNGKESSEASQMWVQTAIQ